MLTMRYYTRFYSSTISYATRRTFYVFNILVLILITSYLLIGCRVDLNVSSVPREKMLSHMSQNESLAKIKQLDSYLMQLTSMAKLNNSRLIHPREVQEMTHMVLDKNQCSAKAGADLLILVMVLNRVDGFERRETIRNTWGKDIKSNSKSKLYFAVGMTTNSTIQEKLIEEDKKYNDIIQWGYYESYYNCTIKVLGILRWTAINCPLVKYVLKVDDDCLLVPDNLLQFCNKSEPSAIYGHLWRNPRVFRNVTSKWAISPQVSLYHMQI